MNTLDNQGNYSVTTPYSFYIHVWYTKYLNIKYTKKFQASKCIETRKLTNMNFAISTSHAFHVWPIFRAGSLWLIELHWCSPLTENPCVTAATVIYHRDGDKVSQLVFASALLIMIEGWLWWLYQRNWQKCRLMTLEIVRQRFAMRQGQWWQFCCEVLQGLACNRRGLRSCSHWCMGYEPTWMGSYAIFCGFFTQTWQGHSCRQQGLD